MENIVVTLIQPDLAWQDKAANLRKFENYFMPLKGKQDLIVLPEMFNTGFVMEPGKIAERMEGDTMEWLAGQAEALNTVITGSLVIEDQGKFYNRLIWMKPDGNYSFYDKRHLFRFGNEHLEFSGGRNKLIVELKGWKICPLICYDLRFPVWSKNRLLEGKYEYDLLVYIANWPGRRSYAYRQLLIARAIENQSYVIGVNRVGVDGKNTLHQGDSAVLDFRGKHLIEIPPDVEDVETVMLDYSALTEFRESFKVGLDWDEFSIY
jgi:predicted amidohydrolase